jgi:drug/metabolite transporter (DMT)-like permease
MMEFIKTLAAIFSAQLVIICGVFFVSGLFLPQFLGGIYAATSATQRLIIGLLTAFVIGNFLMSFAYKVFPPHLTAPITMFSMVLLQIVFAVWIYKIQINPWLYPASALVLGSCIWVSLLLQAKPPV